MNLSSKSDWRMKIRINSEEVVGENVQSELVIKIENVGELFLTKKFPKYLINQQTQQLFKTLEINTTFLKTNPTEFKNDTFY